MWMCQWTREYTHTHLSVRTDSCMVLKTRGSHRLKSVIWLKLDFTQNCRSTDCQMVYVCSYVGRSGNFRENWRAKNGEMSFGLFTVGAHTHTHRERARERERHTPPYQHTPEDLMAFRSHPFYYGHPQSAFSGTSEGNESAPGIIQEIYRGLQQANEMDAWPFLFFLCIRWTLRHNGPSLHSTSLYLGASFTFRFFR